MAKVKENKPKKIKDLTKEEIEARLKIIPRICQEDDSYVRHYPQIVEKAMKQLEKQLWFSSEMKVELDRMQLLYDLSEEQLHTVKYILSIFLKYELLVGNFWKTVAETFPRHEVKIGSSVFEMTERAIHAEFYDQINKVLGLDTDEHYKSWTQDPELAERVKWLDSLLESEDKILATSIFSMTETALLFSLFAVLKSFQTSGMNLIPVIVRGTNQSAVDEDLHGQASADIINTYYAEIGVDITQDTERYSKILEALHWVRDHEHRIIDKAIIGDSLNGHSKASFKLFTDYRLNVYCERLGIPSQFTVDPKDCPVIDWFEKNTYAYKMVDFFSTGVGMEYETAWDTHSMVEAFCKGEVNAN